MGVRAAEIKAQSIEALAFWSKLDLNAIWTPPARAETHSSLADALPVASLGPDRRAAPRRRRGTLPSDPTQSDPGRRAAEQPKRWPGY